MLTPQQEEEAKRLYITSQLTSAQLEHANFLKELDAEIGCLQEKYNAAQKLCEHPLIAREHKNEGSSGGWDRDSDSYWTSHKCTLCNMRWTTHQRWKYVGGQLGLPTDPEAKDPKNA